MGALTPRTSKSKTWLALFGVVSVILLIFMLSLAYVLIDTDQTHAIINGDFRIRYANGAAADLIDLEDVVLGEILGVPQSVSLTDQNIAIVQQAVDEIIAGSSISNITVSGAGSTSHLVNRFIIEVRLTITHVVEQKVEIFDPF